MRAHQMRRQRARPDHHQMRGVLARQIGRRERGGAGGAPGGEHRAVHHGERLAGVARHQHVAAVDRRLVDLQIVRIDADQLAADEALARIGPGRHQQQLRLAPRGLRDHVGVAQRRRDVAAERLAQRLDQRRIGQRAVDLVGGDDAHQAADGCRRRWRRSMSAAAGAACGWRGFKPAAQRRVVGLRGFQLGGQAARAAAPFALARPGGGAADDHADDQRSQQHEEQRHRGGEHRRLAAERIERDRHRRAVRDREHHDQQRDAGEG